MMALNVCRHAARSTLRSAIFPVRALVSSNLRSMSNLSGGFNDDHDFDDDMGVGHGSGYNPSRGGGPQSDMRGFRPPITRRPGDWDCQACGAMVFASKTHCFKCHAPRSGMEDSGSSGYTMHGGGGQGRFEMRAGDWNCPDCNFHNFASRQECFKCNTSRPAETHEGFY